VGGEKLCVFITAVPITKLFARGGGAWLLFFVSARTNKRHHHLRRRSLLCVYYCSTYYKAVRLLVVAEEIIRFPPAAVKTPNCNLPPNQIVSKFLNLKSTPFVQYGSFPKNECFTGPRGGTEHNHRLLPRKR
jgi:hypothetical protein